MRLQLSFQFPLRNLFVFTAGFALLFGSIRIGVELGVVRWIVLWDFGCVMGMLAAFHMRKPMCLGNTALSAAVGAACMMPMVVLYWAAIDGIAVFSQLWHDPFIHLMLLLHMAIMGFAYGGIFGIVFFLVCIKVKVSAR